MDEAEGGVALLISRIRVTDMRISMFKYGPKMGAVPHLQQRSTLAEHKDMLSFVFGDPRANTTTTGLSSGTFFSHFRRFGGRLGGRSPVPHFLLLSLRILSLPVIP
jgi:hypothetical protein